MTENFIAGPNGSETFNNHYMIEGLKNILAGYRQEFNLTDTAIIEMPARYDEAPSILLGISSNVGKILGAFQNYLSRSEVNENTYFYDNTFFAAKIPVFARTDHFLFSSLPSVLNLGHFIDSSQKVIRSLSNYLEHQRVTEHMLDLSSGMAIAQIAGHYVHRQESYFKDLEEQFQKMSDQNITDSLQLLNKGKDLLKGFSKAFYDAGSIKVKSIASIVASLSQYALFFNQNNIFKPSLPGKSSKIMVPGQLYDVIGTLIFRSYQSFFSERGRVPLVTLDILLNEAGQRLEIAHTDTGKAMTRSEKERLFSPFESNIGFKMFTAKRLMESLRGTLTLAYSDSEKGTQFVLSLPYENKTAQDDHM